MADDGYLVGFEDGSGNFVEVGRFNNQAEDVTQPIEIRHTDSGNQITIGPGGINLEDAGIQEVPTGGIMMWSGSTTNIPEGWTLCDGSGGAPDLRNRFIAGAGGQYNSNDTGGEDDVTLTEAEMPSHSHTGSTDTDGSHRHAVRGFQFAGNGPASVSDNDGGQNNYNVGEDFMESSGSHSHNVTTTDTGGDQAHENRPQFYALAFIYKL